MTLFLMWAVPAAAAPKDHFGDLIEALGPAARTRPGERAAREAVALNTVLIIHGAGVCHLDARTAVYRKERGEAIEESLLAAYGARREQERQRIMQAIDTWWARTDLSGHDRMQFCTMVDKALAHIGY
ncbi:MAG TPA: hypothetical protein VFW22_09880 [Pseudolabrys sp.]|nr:hypothetical protein [Pseudolabrys sp.]